MTNSTVHTHIQHTQNRIELSKYLSYKWICRVETDRHEMCIRDSLKCTFHCLHTTTKRNSELSNTGMRFK